MVIGDVVRRNAKRLPKKKALIFEEKSYTLKELDDRVNRLANGLLSLGHKKSDGIALKKGLINLKNFMFWNSEHTSYPPGIYKDTWEEWNSGNRLLVQ